jgi:hypothetical protein
MVSFDVESLFTNKPTHETIDIILNRAFKNSSKYHGLNKDALKKLLIICTQKSHFQLLRSNRWSSNEFTTRSIIRKHIYGRIRDEKHETTKGIGDKRMDEICRRRFYNNMQEREQ